MSRNYFRIIFTLRLLVNPVTVGVGQGQQTSEGTKNPVPTSSNGAMPGVHLQRDRVYNSPAILKPQTVLWKTGQLFVTTTRM